MPTTEATALPGAESRRSSLGSCALAPRGAVTPKVARESSAWFSMVILCGPLPATGLPDRSGLPARSLPTFQKVWELGSAARFHCAEPVADFLDAAVSPRMGLPCVSELLMAEFWECSSLDLRSDSGNELELQFT